jgi:hypothetical protein
VFGIAIVSSPAPDKMTRARDVTEARASRPRKITVTRPGIPAAR